MCLKGPEAVVSISVSMDMCSQYELCSASQPGDRLYLTATTVSVTLKISPDTSAGTVCAYLSVGSFPYLDADFLSYLRWILFLICISREETVSSFRLFYI